MSRKLRITISISLLLGITSVFGQVIDQDAPSLTRDQQILDDLIVDGSTCVGNDCVNGESFGFSTIKLKENNLRIEFHDTSTSASFPSNDWQITINDSANGGANKFSIDDITGGRTPFTIEASAPSHSLYVDDGGRIGVGTSTPVADVHVKSGNTPALRLEQDGSSGFTPQTWDVASNETNFFIRDATNGSRLPFRIRPSAPSNSIYVNTNGDVGLGTDSPDAKLEVLGTTIIGRENDQRDFLVIRPFYEASAGIGDAFLSVRENISPDSQGSTRLILQTFNSNSNRSTLIAENTGNVTIQGDVTANGMLLTSDLRLKKNVQPYRVGLDLVKNLNPISYQFNGKGGKLPGRTHIGLAAQELQKHAPYLVYEFMPDVRDENNNLIESENYLKIDDSAIKYIMLNSIKEQQELIVEQSEKIDQLQSLSNELIQRLEALEKRELPNTNIELKNSASLGQNYPNPYADRTQVEYYLPAKIISARIIVHDINGKLISSKSITEKGKGTVTFLADDLPTGQYSYSLEVDGRIIDTKQMSVSYR